MDPHESWLYVALSTFYERATDSLRSSLYARSEHVRSVALRRLQTLVDGDAESIGASLASSSPSSPSSSSSASVSAPRSARDEMAAVQRATRVLAGAAPSASSQEQLSAAALISRHARALRELAERAAAADDPLRAETDAAVIAALQARFTSLRGDDARLALVTQYNLLVREIAKLQIALVSYVAECVSRRLLDIQRLSQHAWLTGLESESLVSSAAARSQSVRAERLVPLLSGRDLALRLLSGALSSSSTSSSSSSHQQMSAAQVYERDLAPRFAAALSLSGSHVRQVMGLLDTWASSSPSSSSALAPDGAQQQLDLTLISARPLASTLSQAERIVETSRRLLRQRAEGKTEDPQLRAVLRESLAETSAAAAAAKPSPKPSAAAPFESAKRLWRQRRGDIEEAWVEREQLRVNAALSQAEQAVFDVYTQARQALRDRHETVLRAVDAAISATRSEIAGANAVWVAREGATLRATQARVRELGAEAARYGSEMSSCVELIDASSRARAMQSVRSIASSAADALTRATETWR